MIQFSLFGFYYLCIIISAAKVQQAGILLRYKCNSALNIKYFFEMECDLYNLPLFRGGNRAAIDKVFQVTPLKNTHYAKGDIIAMQGYECRSIFLLCEGSAYARMISEDGRELTLDTLSAPEVLASSFIFSTQGTFPVTIIAATDCDIQMVGRDKIQQLIETDATVRQNFLRIISDHSMFLSNRVAEFALKTLSSRIVSYMENYGPLTNLQETAFIMGVARSSLSRVVSQLVSQGVLKKTADGYALA